MAVYAYVTGIGAPIGHAIGGGIEQVIAASSAAGQSAGTCTVVGVATSDALSAGTAAGTSTAVGVIVGDLLSVGTAAGTCTVVAVGRSDRTAAGTSAGLATALGVGLRTTPRIRYIRRTIRAGGAEASIGIGSA